MKIILIFILTFNLLVSYGQSYLKGQDVVYDEKILDIGSDWFQDSYNYDLYFEYILEYQNIVEESKTCEEYNKKIETFHNKACKEFNIEGFDASNELIKLKIWADNNPVKNKDLLMKTIYKHFEIFQGENSIESKTDYWIVDCLNNKIQGVIER